jgi:Arc/MetJ-type ribon-helix-helix transcriptional regulator
VTRTKAKEERIGVRLPAWLLEAIDDEAERLRVERPGAEVNRSDVVRELLARALAGKQRTSAKPDRRL